MRTADKLRLCVVVVAFLCVFGAVARHSLLEKSQAAAQAETFVQKATGKSPLTNLTMIVNCDQGMGGCAGHKYTVYVFVPDPNTGKPSAPIHVWGDKNKAVFPPEIR